MQFNSITFLFVFLPVFLGVYFLLPAKAKNYFILFGSFVFLAWASVSFLLLILFSVLINFQLGLIIDNQQDKHIRKSLFVIALILNLLALLVFKYAGFMVVNFSVILNVFGLKSMKNPGLFLPLGISFYTFRILSYHIELYRQKIQVQKNIANLALYIAFFPQLSAGPIVRYRDFFPGKKIIP